MLTIDVPGFKRLSISHVVSDYNGTLAVDGRLLPGVAARLKRLSKVVEIHVLTADTFGLVRAEMRGLPCTISVLPSKNSHQAKLRYVRRLNVQQTICIGNGRNDRLMLKAAAVGICLIQKEGAAAASLSAASVVCLSANDALDLLLHPRRLVATLRT